MSPPCNKKHLIYINFKQTFNFNFNYESVFILFEKIQIKIFEKLKQKTKLYEKAIREKICKLTVYPNEIENRFIMI